MIFLVGLIFWGGWGSKEDEKCVQMQKSSTQKNFKWNFLGSPGGQLWDLMMERIFAGLAKSSIFIVCRVEKISNPFHAILSKSIEFSNFCFPNEDSAALFGNAHFWRVKALSREK